MAVVIMWQLLSQNFPIVLSENGLLVLVLLSVVAILLATTTHHFEDVKEGSSRWTPYLRFVYVSFIKPHDADTGEGQQSALESFYSAQASIYDATRKQLLRGREDMLGIVAAQLSARIRGPTARRLVWYDIGGGTGYNIEVLDNLVGIETFFHHVYLVDLSPSLCEVARRRVKQFGWKNVTVLCQDARAIQQREEQADLITMSYSLSMIPDFYNVVDLLTNLLKPDGLIGICDFYVQSIVDVSSRNYTGGVINRHVNWFGRMFWRTWFDADRVNLDAGRRDYVEYRFGTILSVSERNYMLGGIPYYVFIGCRREAALTRHRAQEVIEKLDAALTESPYLSAQDYQNRASSEALTNVPRSKLYESAIVNLTSNLPLPASFYQQHQWRINYNDLLAKHEQFKDEYIYAFNWEDPKVDRQLLNITKEDVMLTITSAGDNILDYLLESPKRVHAVDLNPNQNHLLELKCAAFTTLSYAECWSLFSEGTHPDFRNLLIHKLSPHLSSHAFQFWLSHTSTFSSSKGGLYNTGGSRHAIKLIRWLFKVSNLTAKVRTLCAVDTLNEQREIWPYIRDVLLSWPLHRLVVSTEWWSWKAAGVPREQRELIIRDFQEQNCRNREPSKAAKEVAGEAIWKYVVDTLDPVVQKTQISRENYFYYVCLAGKYGKRCHPRYLSPKSYAKLSKPAAFDNLRIHTDELMEVITRLAPSALTIVILMDSMDWFTPAAPSNPATPEIAANELDDEHSEPRTATQMTKMITTALKQAKSGSKSSHGPEAAERQIMALHRVLRVGGRVLLRSASLQPWYMDIFSAQGFKVECVARRVNGVCIDRVNMYASTWICTRVMPEAVIGVVSGLVNVVEERGRGLKRAMGDSTTANYLEELSI